MVYVPIERVRAVPSSRTLNNVQSYMEMSLQSYMPYDADLRDEGVSSKLRSFVNY